MRALGSYVGGQSDTPHMATARVLACPVRSSSPQAHPHYAPSPFLEPNPHYAAPIGYTALFYMCCLLLYFCLYIYIYIYIYKGGYETLAPNLSGCQSTRLQRGHGHTPTVSQAPHQQRGDTRPTPQSSAPVASRQDYREGIATSAAVSQAPHKSSRMVASRQDCSEGNATSLPCRKLKNGCQSTRLQRGHGHISVVSQAPHVYTGILDPRSVLKPCLGGYWTHAPFRTPGYWTSRCSMAKTAGTEPKHRVGRDGTQTPYR